MSRDAAYLLDIYQSAQIIQGFVLDMDEDKFNADIKTQDAVIRRLAIMGEAAKRVSSELKEHYPAIPWRSMSGMRDILVHDYNKVNLERVWRVIIDEMPQIILQIEPLITPDIR